jgi:hypothetical protein
VPAELEAPPSSNERSDAPVAGATPAAIPERPAETDSPVVSGPIVMSAPPDAIKLPGQRPGGDHPAPLRRRVPGGQLPADTGTRLESSRPSADEAQSARAVLEAFEEGVSRAHWDVIEADMSSPPAAGHSPLARRVPGATLPPTESPKADPPAPRGGRLDPDAARALVEQFEHGVALALRETQPRHEGRPR